MTAGDTGPLRTGWLAVPHRSRLSPDDPRRDEILARHDRAVASHLSIYVDPASGYTVLTAAYLAEQGSCCANACRHCPWEGAEDQSTEPAGPG